MTKQRVLVLFGGPSPEHEISLRSAASVLAALDPERFVPVLVGMGRDRVFRQGQPGQPLAEIVASGEVVTDLRALAPDVVFPVLHGGGGEDGLIQGHLETLGLPYVGSDVAASAVCMDKSLQKHLIRALAPEISQTRWIDLSLATFRASDGQRQADAIAAELGLPCFVKPARCGSSVGITRCTDSSSLHDALVQAFRFDSKLVIEQAVDAREIEFAVLGDPDDGLVVSAPGEIVLPPGTWYDYDNKYNKDVAVLQIPAGLSDAGTQSMQAMARRAFTVLGCSGLARVDFLVDRKSERAYLNELNTMPGFTSISMYPKLIEHGGIDYRELVTRLCSLAMVRHERRAALVLHR